MYYAKLVDNKPVRINIADEVPVEVFTVDTSEETLSQYGVVVVNDPVLMPTYNHETHGVAETTPVKGEDGKWYASYVVVEKAPDQSPLHLEDSPDRTAAL